VNPAQVRMARTALNWSSKDLANAARIHRNIVSSFESGRFVGSLDAVDAMRSSLESAGIIFVDDNGETSGVRLGKAAVGLDAAIKEAEQRSTVDMPTGPRSASGMAQLRRGLAENQLRTLKEKKRGTKRRK
jgi:transcriptional regulator with XRE-family HTH domain